MFIKKELSKEQIILQINGPIEGQSGETFQQYLNELLASPYKIIIFDLSKSDCIDSSSLGKILLFRHQLKNQKRSLQIRGCSDQLYDIFKLIMFDRIIDIKKERLTAF